MSPTSSHPCPWFQPFQTHSRSFLPPGHPRLRLCEPGAPHQRAGGGHLRPPLSQEADCRWRGEAEPVCCRPGGQDLSRCPSSPLSRGPHRRRDWEQPSDEIPPVEAGEQAEGRVPCGKASGSWSPTLSPASLEESGCFFLDTRSPERTGRGCSTLRKVKAL